MQMSDDGSMGWTQRRTGLEPMSRDEWWVRLGEASLGRVGVLAGQEPLVLPINLAVDGDRIVFRTGAGTKFHAMVSGRPISVEIDGVDETYHHGWSVLAVGRAEEVTDDLEVARLAATVKLRPWAGGDKTHWMVLDPDRVTGRRIAV
jgi:nitroimidazol reductase NimA-like FMN-containing flavoprotein (pyridoxamine 5'-phosphate oxidase superfamily)